MDGFDLVHFPCSNPFFIPEIKQEALPLGSCD